MIKEEELKFYDFEIFKAFVEVEVNRINRYKRSTSFSIAFLYFPSINLVIDRKPGNVTKLRNELRNADVVSIVDEDFIFLFLPETDKKQISMLIERLKKTTDINFIEGTASYPEDGKTAREMFSKIVQIMNEKLIPIAEI